MKRILLSFIGLSFIAMLSAFSRYNCEDECSNYFAKDTVVNDTVKIIKDKQPEEWGD